MHTCMHMVLVLPSSSSIFTTMPACTFAKVGEDCWNILLFIIFQYHYVGKYRNDNYINYLSIVSLN